MTDLISISTLFHYITENCLIIIPVLYAVGILIKHTKIIKNKYIPLVLLFVGIVMCIVITRSITNGIVQGTLCAGTAVFGNQMFKQFRKYE
jgi:NhaP-type Na+/H+ or K+/H+ antiporter